jgi:hypothetical protein
VRAAALARLERLGGVATRFVNSAGIRGKRTARGQAQTERKVTAQLQRSLHQVLCDQGDFGEITPPDSQQNSVEIDEEQFEFVTALHVAPPHHLHFGAGLLESPDARRQ